MEENEFIRWSVLEYEDRPKTRDWFWAIGIIAVCGFIASIIYKNYLFAILILLSTVVILMFSVRKPEQVEVEIGPRGIKVKNNFYAYQNLKGFAVVVEPEEKTLLLESGRIFLPIIAVPLGETDPEKLRYFLSSFVEEKNIKEPTFHKVMDFLGF